MAVESGPPSSGGGSDRTPGGTWTSRRAADGARARRGDPPRSSRLRAEPDGGRPCRGHVHAKVGRIERAEYPSLQFIELAALLAVVGLELSARAYPKGSPLRDRAHRLLLGALHGLLHPALSWVEEVPLPNPGDLRSWDALIRGGSRRTGVEAEMRPRDGQELHRRLASKRRDGGVDETILLLADTRSNRAFLAEVGDAFAGDFPVAGQLILQDLAIGRSPRGSGIVLLRLGRRSAVR